jgi:hypothetical protein
VDLFVLKNIYIYTRVYKLVEQPITYTTHRSCVILGFSVSCSKLEEQKWKISRKSLKIKIQRRITQKIRIQTTMNILLVLCTLIVSVMSKTVTIKEYEGHGCEGEPKSTSTYEITMGCTSGNVISSFQSTCDMYSFKLTYEMFLGSTTCEKQCSSSLCYDKTEMYVCLVLSLSLYLSFSLHFERTTCTYPIV